MSDARGGIRVTLGLRGRAGGISWLVAGVCLLLLPAIGLLVASWQRFEIPDPLKLALLLAGATAWSLWRAVRGLGEARLMEDKPTARIESAAQGYAEFSGVAEGEPLACRIGGAHCLWSEFRVERKRLFDKRAVTLRDHTDTRPFTLRDPSGECLVYPDRARVITGTEWVWYGGEVEPRSIPGAGARWLSRVVFGPVCSGWALLLFPLPILAGFVLHLGSGPALAGYVVAFASGYVTAGLLGPYRYELRMIRPSEPLYALGTFSSDARDPGGRSRHQLADAPGEHRPFILSTLSQAELIRRSRRVALPYFALFVILLAATGQVLRTYF